VSDEALRLLECEAVSDPVARSRYRLEAARHGDLRPLRRDLAALLRGHNTAKVIGGFEVCLKDLLIEVPGELAFSWVRAESEVQLLVEDEEQVTLGAKTTRDQDRDAWLPVEAWPELAPWSLRRKGETAHLDGYGFGQPAVFASARIHATKALIGRLRQWARTDATDCLCVPKAIALALNDNKVSHIDDFCAWSLEPGAI
jgi:hypothetical protein